MILHGLGGSGPDHWQSWLARRIRARDLRVSYPELPDPDRPSLQSWLEVARAAVEASGRESTVVCHSLASLLWIYLAHRSNRRLADRVLLVAPPSEAAVLAEAAEFAPAPLDPVSIAGAARHTRLVCAPRGEDPCPEGELARCTAPRSTCRPTRSGAALTSTPTPATGPADDRALVPGSRGAADHRP